MNLALSAQPLVRALIANVCGIPLQDVRTHERLVEDLGIDSLDMADLLVGIENNLGVVIDAEALASIQTVMHLEDAVAERVAAVA